MCEICYSCKHLDGKNTLTCYTYAWHVKNYLKEPNNHTKAYLSPNEKKKTIFCTTMFSPKYSVYKVFGMMHIWCPWKLSNFQDPLPPLSINVQNSSIPLTLDVQFQTNPPSSNDNQSIKRKHNPRMTIMLPGPSFRSAFVFSINSLILPGFPLTSFDLAEASLSAFLWLYTFVCAVAQKYYEMSFIIIHIFSTHFFQSTCFNWTNSKFK